MPIIKIQSESERQRGVYYELNTDFTPIGGGGMGQVYKGLCVQEATGATRPVAIKVVADGLPYHALDRARREANIRLRNDCLVEMLDYVETTDTHGYTHRYIVSELLDGVTLKNLLRGICTTNDGRPVAYAQHLCDLAQNEPERFALVVIINVLSGVMALHDAGYIHRDIDPSNIMITSDGHIKLIDFGICKRVDDVDTGGTLLTSVGSFMGKATYAAPELAKGDVAHENFTTDIYAIGILLYECIVGKPPFLGSTHDVLDMQIKGRLPLDNVAHKEFRNIIAKACAKEQKKRYQSAAQMRVALDGVSLNGDAPSGGNSRKRMFCIVGLIAIVSLCLASVYVYFNQQPEIEVSPQPVPPEPVIDEHEADSLEQLRRQQHEDSLKYLQLLEDSARMAEEAERLAAEEEARREAALDEGMKDLAEQAKKKKAAEEEAKRKAAEEEAMRKLAEQAAAMKKKAAEEEAKRKAAEDEAMRKLAEQAAAKKKKAAEEEAKRKAAEEEAMRKLAEQAKKKKAAEEEAKRKAAEEAAKKQSSNNLAYGSWSGRVQGGKPTGRGTLVFSSSKTFAVGMGSVTAQKGYRYEGEFENGEPTEGRLYDASGKLIQTIIN